MDNRNALWSQILDEQFDLSYYVKGFTYEDTEKMSIFERHEMYQRLIARKKEEKEAHEAAIKAAEDAKNSAARKHPRRRR